MKNMQMITMVFMVLLGGSPPSWPQTQYVLRIKVVNEFDRPMPKISFRISFVGDYRSDPNGECLINLPADKGPGQPLEFFLKNDTLAIWAPAGGRDYVPDRDALFLKLLPTGDHRLLNREEMKALMNKLIQERTLRLQARLSELEKQYAEKTDPLADEAKRLGFSKEELITSIEKQKQIMQESPEPYDVGLASLYDKHYGNAARLIALSIQRSEKIIAREKQRLAEKWLNLGIAQFHQNKIDSALTAFNSAIALQPNYTNAYIYSSFVYSRKGNFKKDVENLRKALGLCDNQSWLYAFTFGLLGNSFALQQMPDSALIYIKGAFQASRKVGNYHGEARALGKLALLYIYNLNAPDSARGYLHAALKIHADRKQFLEAAFVLEKLSLMHLKLNNNPDSAHMYYLSALKIKRILGNRDEEAATLSSLGDFFSESKQPDSAFVYYGAALRLYRDIKNPYAEAGVLLSIGRFFRDLVQQPDSANTFLSTALKNYQKSGDSLNVAITYSDIGLTFGTKEPDSARTYFMKSLGILSKLRHPLFHSIRKVMDGYNNLVSKKWIALGGIYEINGKFDTALVCYKIAWNDSHIWRYRSGELAALNCQVLLFHERLFNYDMAFKADRLIILLDSTNTSSLANFAENHFTTSRFAECEQRLTALLANPEVSASTKIALRAIQIANALAQNKTQQVAAALETLQQNIAAQPDTFKVGWTFEGTKHFISSEPKLARYREWLLQLFAAVENPNGREAILSALREAREKFKTVAGK